MTLSKKASTAGRSSASAASAAVNSSFSTCSRAWRAAASSTWASTRSSGKPRALVALVRPTAQLAALQAEHESIARRAGMAPETRKFTPHVTLARLRGTPAEAAAFFIASMGRFPVQRFNVSRFALFSSRASIGGGPYVVEAAYPLAGSPLDQEA